MVRTVVVKNHGRQRELNPATVEPPTVQHLPLEHSCSISEEAKLILFLLFLLKLLRHGIYVVVRALVVFIDPPLPSVIEVGDKISLGQCTLLQCISCLIEVYLGVAWGHLNGLQVFQIVKHNIIANITVGVLAFEPTDKVTIDEVEMKEGAPIHPSPVDGDAQDGVDLFHQ
jgi:hypothetical protein